MGKLEEALMVLEKLGLPKKQQNARSAYTLLALLDLKESDPWSKSSINLIGIHEIIQYINENYGIKYAENTRESIRRQTIHQFEQAGIIERNADDPQRPTNSGKTVYSIIPEVLDVFKSFGSDNWEKELKNFFKKKEALIEAYSKKREIYKVPIKLDNKILLFSAGDHNLLQKIIIKEFASRFAKGSKVLYVGDTANKNLYKLDGELENLGIPMTKHDKLPDVVLYNYENNWLYLCEAVTTHGPVSPKRYIELEEMLAECQCGKIYVSCFLDFQTYKKYCDDIAWETEIWIAEMPDHLIHYNGDRFIGPR